MTIHVCAICGVRVINPVTSSDMTGKVLCYDHFYQAREKMHKVVYDWVNTVTAGSPCDICDIDYPSCDHCLGS